MAKTKEINQHDKFSYSVIYKGSNIQFELNLKHNDQALSIIVIKKNFNKSITFKETFSLDKLSKATYPYFSYNSIIEFKNEIIKIIQTNLFDIKEENDKITVSLQFYHFNEKLINREFHLPKFQEEYEKDFNVLFSKISGLVKHQENKIAQIQTKNNEIENRINVLDQKVEQIYAFLNDCKYANYNSIQPKEETNKQPNISKNPLSSKTSEPLSINANIIKSHAKNQIRKTLPASRTISNFNAFNDYAPITNWISRSRFIQLESLYLGSKYNFSSSSFHCNFDNAVPTVTIVTLDNGAIFGGFTCQIWKGENEDKADQEAFLFSINHNKKYPIRRSQIKTAIHCRQKYIVAFGNLNCFDFAIVDQGNKYECISEFPNCYGNNEQKYSLTLGRKKFGIKEIEIFQIHYSN